MPELPEVEALAMFVAEKAAATMVERAELGSLSALKTYRPPLDALVGQVLAGAERRGKYLCISFSEFWLVTHLARGGWLHWRDPVPPARARPGKGPLALRVGLSSGAGFDLTEQGTEKRLALWLVEDPAIIEGIARLGPDPLSPSFDQSQLAAALSRAPGS